VSPTEGPPPIGSSCNFIKIRDYTIKQKTQAQGGASRYYDITANYDLIYNTIVANSSGTNYKIQKSDNIISKPVFWLLLPKSYITINQSNIISIVQGFIAAGTSDDIDGSFNITPPTNVSTNCCLLPTVTYSGPRNAYRMPCSGGPAKRALLQPCTNPTISQQKIN